jgi:hypothetical protein
MICMKCITSYALSTKVKSLSLEKTPSFTGRLTGIKGSIFCLKMEPFLIFVVQRDMCQNFCRKAVVLI